jgi:iron(III) transport system substrate-binding protein
MDRFHVVFREWQSLAIVGLVALAVACAPAAPAPAPPTAPPAKPPAPAEAAKPASVGKQALDDLVRKANQEGELLVSYTTQWTKELTDPLANAFMKRFGIKLTVNGAVVRSSDHLAVAIAETQSGAPATYDVTQASDGEMIQLIGANGTQQIASWEALLAEINPLVAAGRVPATRISRGPFAGRAFEYYGNVKQIVYNPKLITADELPKVHTDLTNPKYKGKFAQPPWTAHWDIAPAVIDNLDRQKWLETVRGAGANSAAIVTETAGAERVALGEFPFALSTETELRVVRAKDPQAPLASKWFDDYNPSATLHYAVRANARHPAAATLWALWISTPEAEQIWQAATRLANLHGDSEIDREVQQGIKQSGRVSHFLDNQKTVALLEWYSTQEGRAYLGALAQAIRGQ